MALKAGTVVDFSDSMAEAIEEALKVEWATVKGIELPSTGEEDRRLLFVAIAQGIVRYLKDNAEASLIVHSVQVTQDTGNNIASSGTTASGGSDLHSHSTNVTQNAVAANRSTSTGDGKLRVDTTGELH